MLIIKSCIKSLITRPRGSETARMQMFQHLMANGTHCPAPTFTDHPYLTYECNNRKGFYIIKYKKIYVWNNAAMLNETKQLNGAGISSRYQINE